MRDKFRQFISRKSYALEERCCVQNACFALKKGPSSSTPEHVSPSVFSLSGVQMCGEEIQKQPRTMEVHTSPLSTTNSKIKLQRASCVSAVLIGAGFGVVPHSLPHFDLRDFGMEGSSLITASHSWQLHERCHNLDSGNIHVEQKRRTKTRHITSTSLTCQ